MINKNFYIINAITLYRLLAAPVLLVLIFFKEQKIFACMLAISFFTDLIDGYLARKFNATSIFGSRMDSIADDLTIFSAIVATFVFRFAFIKENVMFVSILLSLYLIQTIYAVVKYYKISSFHTYLAKTAAIFQGVFFIALFYLEKPPAMLFYIAFAVTVLDLLEEIVLVYKLPIWKTDVKGIYWVLKRNPGNFK